MIDEGGRDARPGGEPLQLHEENGPDPHGPGGAALRPLVGQGWNKVSLREYTYLPSAREFLHDFWELQTTVNLFFNQKVFFIL